MKTIISDATFAGERPLFGLHGVRLERVRIEDGESGIKCCADIEADGCTFIGKYPWWHVDGALISNSHFCATARSAMWYSRNIVIRDTLIDAPKLFREMDNLHIENVVLTDADETFWGIHHLVGRNLTLHNGRYPFMHCDDVCIDGLESNALYVFQYCKNVVLRHAKITTKDAFWECDHVTVYDSVLDGEYLGWHSRDIHLVRCHIVGEQPLSYMDGITLDDCTFDAASDRAFEDSTAINARINGHITNIKNPVSGAIIADSIGSVTIDENVKQPNSCVIRTTKEQ